MVMKKSRLIGAMVFSTIMFNSTLSKAATATYTDSNDYYNPLSFVQWSKDWRFISAGSYTTWTFDITEQGFDPLVDNVLSVELSVRLADDQVVVHGGGDSDGSHGDPSEFGWIDADSELFYAGELDAPQIYTFQVSPDAIQDDGMLVVIFTSLEGDSVYDRSSLIVETSTIPVPSAVWLFGSGLIGLLGFARRKT